MGSGDNDAFHAAWMAAGDRLLADADTAATRESRCPTLLTSAENDARSRTAETVFAELTCPKTLLRFTAAEGAGDHCEIANRSLATQRMFDWLAETLRLDG